MAVDPQTVRSERHVKIGQLIQQDAGVIIERWRQRAIDEQPQAKRIHQEALLDHLPALLQEIGRTLAESDAHHTSGHHRPARDHGIQRWEEGWSVAEVVRDFQILRLVLTDYLQEVLERPLHGREILAIGLALDEAIASSLCMYGKFREEHVRRVEREKAEGDRQAEAALLRREAETWKEASRRKDDFLAVLGHELRNPLAPLRNAVHVVRLKGDDPATRAWVADMLERQVAHMTRLIDELLDASRIGRGKVLLQLERIDLARLIRTVVEDHRAAIEAANLTMQVNLPPDPVWVQGDATRLAQVFANLLENALKFTDGGGRIEIRSTIDPRARRAIVRVSDTGIGIAPEMLPYVFETFRQAEESLRRSRGGLGLGLALVKGLVELHGGEVSAQSAGTGQGASFTVWLALSP